MERRGIIIIMAVVGILRVARVGTKDVTRFTTSSR